MGILILGLVLFIGIHLVQVLTPLRRSFFGTLGEKKYKAGFSLISALGLVLIVIGYAMAPSEPRLFAPYPFAVMIAPLAMLVSFILLAAANMRTHIRHTLRHPMLLGVGIWSLVHLLANGEAKAVLLFGSFLAYTVVDLASATSRHTAKPFTPVARQDVMAVTAGIVLALLVMFLHRPLFGVQAVHWGW